MTCEVLANLVCEWGYPGVFNGNAVEWLEAVDYAKGFSIFLDDAKPS